MSRVVKDIVRFFKSHWPHVLLGLPMALLVTVLHESAHAGAVVLQGGEVTQFDWLPSGARWGYMRFAFPSGVTFSSAAISFAPYACWLALCLLAGLLALRRRAWPFWGASTLFVWLFIGPLADIANTAIPYVLYNAANDFQDVFGPVRATVVAGLVVFAMLTIPSGFVLQKRLYRERAIGLPAYGILAAAGIVLMLAATCLPWHFAS